VAAHISISPSVGMRCEEAGTIEIVSSHLDRRKIMEGLTNREEISR
jgi:hypothetical protein